RHRTGNRRLHLPFRAALSRTPPATAVKSASDRSADPAVDAIPRSHRKPNPSGERLMHLIELESALRQLRLGGMAAVLEPALQQAQAEPMAPIDLISCLVSDELTRRSDRLLERRRKAAQCRDPQTTLDNFDFGFNKKMNRSLIFDLATAAFISRREDVLFLAHRYPQEPFGSGH